MKRAVLFLIIVLVVSMAVTSEINAKKTVAIAEFEMERDLRHLRTYLNESFQQELADKSDRWNVKLKERLRTDDLIDDFGMDFERRKRLRRNIGADYIILPRVQKLNVTDQRDMSINLLSEKGKELISFGKETVTVETKVEARIVSLHTGTIKDRVSASNDESINLTEVKIGDNLLREKGGVVEKNILHPAVERLAIRSLDKMERFDQEITEEEAVITEVKPHGLENVKIAEVTSVYEDRFNVDREVQINKPTKTGGVVPVAEGVIQEREGDVITVEITNRKEVEITRGGLITPLY